MGNTARIGFIMVAVGFPLYLLWKGRIPVYLALTSASATPAAASPATANGTTAPTGGITSLQSSPNGTTGAQPSTGNSTVDGWVDSLSGGLNWLTGP